VSNCFSHFITAYNIIIIIAAADAAVAIILHSFVTGHCAVKLAL